MNRLSKPFALLLVLALALPAAAAVSDEDIDRARAELDSMLAESESLGIEVQEAWARQFALEKEIEDLNASIDLAQARIAETEQRLQDVAVEMYMGSTRSASLQVLFSEETEGYGAGVEYLRNVSGTDQDLITQLRSFRDELDHQTGRLADASIEQEQVTADLEQMAEQLQGELTEAQQAYDQLVEQQRREEEEARRRAEEEARRQAEAAAAEAARNATTTTVADAPSGGGGGGTGGGGGGDDDPTPSPAPPTTPGGGTCPVAGAVAFSNSWGEPRSGGRAHKGVDMIAARGTPVVAIYSGTIQRFSNSSLGGKSIYFRANGDMFYYAHLDDFGDFGPGQSVEVGQVIGYVGSTGNAPSWLPHLHFEWHPGGGGAVNPYQLVRDLC